MNKNKLLAVLCLLTALGLLLLPGYFDKLGQSRGLAVLGFDVGQGDAVLVSADGCHVLIDAGGRPANVTGAAEYVVIPYLKARGIGRLDMVFNTHPDIDHIGGIFAVLDEIEVDCLAVFNGYPENDNHEQLLRLAADKRVPVLPVAAGDVFTFSENFSIKVLAPAAGESFAGDMVNNGSLVLQISYQDFDVLLTGDLQGEQLRTAVAALDCADIEVLQLPHHGSRNSYDEEWYANFAPEAVFISVGRDNSYGHPDAEVVDYWRRRGVAVWRTDLHGACLITYKNGGVEYSAVRTPELPEAMSNDD